MRSSRASPAAKALRPLPTRDDEVSDEPSGSEDAIDLREGWASWRSSSDSGWSNQPLRLEAVHEERVAFAREMHARSAAPPFGRSFALAAALPAHRTASVLQTRNS